MFRSLTKLGAQAHTIAYLADGFLDPYQVEIVQGLLETARSGGANLLCFIGGPLPRDAQNSDGRHGVYDLATRTVCDGFVISGTGLNHEVGTHSGDVAVPAELTNPVVVHSAIASPVPWTTANCSMRFEPT